MNVLRYILLLIVTTILFSQEENTIFLHEGPNLISFYVIPEDNSVENVLSQLGDNALSIATSGEAALNLGDIWVGSLIEILPQNGYWMITEDAAELTLSGVPISPYQTYSLNYGANLISYPFSFNLDFESAFNSETIWNINGIIAEGQAAVNINGQFYGSLVTFSQNCGYWFLVNNMFTFYYNNSGCEYFIAEAEEEVSEIFYEIYNSESISNCFDNLDDNLECITEVLNFNDAITLYDQALAQCPESPAANFGSSIVNLMSIITDPELNELLNRWFDFFDDDSLNRLSDFSRGLPTGNSSFAVFNSESISNMLPALVANPMSLSQGLGRGTSSDTPYLQELQDLLESVFLSKINLAIERMNYVVEQDYNFIITGEMQGDIYQSDIEMDDTEFYLIKSYLHFFNALFHIITTYDVSEVAMDLNDFTIFNKDHPFLTIREGRESNLPYAYLELIQLYTSLDNSYDHLISEIDWQENDYIDNNFSEDQHDEIEENLETVKECIYGECIQSIEGCDNWECSFEYDGYWQDTNCDCVGESVEMEHLINIGAFMNSPPDDMKGYIPDYTFVNDLCNSDGVIDFEVCEDLYYEQDCQTTQDCHWETNFCHPTFEGMPCEQIMDESECIDNDCEWIVDDMGAHCVFPMHEPWMDCILLDEWECEENPACEVADGYGYDDGYDDDYDDYYDNCMYDCPEPDFSGLDYDNATDDEFDAVYCDWVNDLYNNEQSGCLSDCTEDGYFGMNVIDIIGFEAYVCNADFPSQECEEIIDDYYYGYDYDDYDYYGYDYDDYDYYGDYSYDDDCTEEGEALCESGAFTDENSCENAGPCIWDSGGCWYDEDSDPCQDGDDSGPPECVEDCAGIDDHSPEDGTPFCEWIVALDDDGCLADCEDGEDCIIEMFEFQCEACLEFDLCDEFFGDDYYYYYADDSYDKKASPQEVLNKIGEKLFEKAKLKSNAFARSSGCDAGYVEDCSGDGDCCDVGWIGDGFADCQDQEFGCDLSCYACEDFGAFGEDYLCIDPVQTPEGNDDGDCDGFVALCEPSSDCFDYNSQQQCQFNSDCDWIFGVNECQPKPSGMQGGPNCGQYTQQNQCSGADEGCEWMPQPGPNGEQCTPTSCHTYHNQNDCNDSPVCAWDPPEWVDPWADGACMLDDPCNKPECQDPGSCVNNPNCQNCQWNEDEWQCLEAGWHDDDDVNIFPCPVLIWSASTYDDWVAEWNNIDITINGLYPEITLEDILALYKDLFNIDENNWKQTIGGG